MAVEFENLPIVFQIINHGAFAWQGSTCLWHSSFEVVFWIIAGAVLTKYAGEGLVYEQVLNGSFSAVSKPIFASKYYILVRKLLTRSLE